MAGQPQGGLSPWREIVTPHPDVSSGCYLQAEFVADLAAVYRGDVGASAEYKDPLKVDERYRFRLSIQNYDDLRRKSEPLH